MNQGFIQGVGLVAPGLPDWEQSLPVLRGERPYAPQPLPRLIPRLLPANERRRATGLIRIALAAAGEAVTASGIEPEQLRSVFASSDGDLEVIDRICEALAQDPEAVSPTLFHNSVHNAPAGYWSIGAKSRLSSTTLSAFDASFTAGLVESWTLMLAEQSPVLLVAYDAPTDGALGPHRPMPAPFACALLLTPQEAARSVGRLSVGLGARGGETPLSDAGLERLRTGNPAARALPLLQALARGGRHEIALPLLRGPGFTVQIES